MKVASPVLNGGDGGTYRKATHPVPTQLRGQAAPHEAGATPRRRRRRLASQRAPRRGVDRSADCGAACPRPPMRPARPRHGGRAPPLGRLGQEPPRAPAAHTACAGRETPRRSPPAMAGAARRGGDMHRMRRCSARAAWGASEQAPRGPGRRPPPVPAAPRRRRASGQRQARRHCCAPPRAPCRHRRDPASAGASRSPHAGRLRGCAPEGTVAQ
jgi:hypothetical protein